MAGPVSGYRYGYIPTVSQCTGLRIRRRLRHKMSLIRNTTSDQARKLNRGNTTMQNKFSPFYLWFGESSESKRQRKDHCNFFSQRVA
jgi:hypothetical protein